MVLAAPLTSLSCSLRCWKSALFSCPQSTFAGSSGMRSSVPSDGNFSPIFGSGVRLGRIRRASKNWMPGSGTVCMMAPDRQCLINGAKGSWLEQAGPNHTITRCCLSMAYPQTINSSVRWSGKVNLCRVSYALCTMCSNCDMWVPAFGILLALTSTSLSRRKTTRSWASILRRRLNPMANGGRVCSAQVPAWEILHTCIMPIIPCISRGDL